MKRLTEPEYLALAAAVAVAEAEWEDETNSDHNSIAALNRAWAKIQEGQRA